MIIRTFLSGHNSPVTQDFFTDAIKLAHNTHVLLLPLETIHRPGTPFKPHPEKDRDIDSGNELMRIVCQAAKLSLDMRRQGPEIYLFCILRKNEPFEEETTSCKNKAEMQRENLWRGDDDVELIKICGFPEVMVYQPGKVGDAIVVADDEVEMDEPEDAERINHWFENDRRYDPNLPSSHRRGFTATRLCQATAILDWGPMRYDKTMGVPSRMTLADGIEEASRKTQRQEEEARAKKINWWTQYGRLPAWGVSAGVTSGLALQTASGIMAGEEQLGK